MEQATWLSRATSNVSDRRSLIRSDPVSDLRCPNPDAMCYGLELELCWLTDLRCNDSQSVCWLVLQHWLRCSVDIFVFRFALVISDLVTWGFWFSDLQCILDFGFYFLFFIFYFFLRICGLVLPVYHLLGCFFCLDWVCFTFRIDVGLFCGLALLHFFFLILECSSFC